MVEKYRLPWGIILIKCIFFFIGHEETKEKDCADGIFLASGFHA
jgi:hypothetical protein